MTDDRRYETYEMRAAYDDRYVVDPNRITSKAAVRAAYAEADRLYVKAGEARARGRAAERDSAEYAAAVRDFAHYAERRADIFRRIREYEARA